ncbi:MAG TPA: flagellar type III secretion system pore protein FliP [Gemmatimonadales bacterium]|nr:flagellar type III secretion system pore protein FliP [Gemmatimonadales bacterium]
MLGVLASLALTVGLLVLTLHLLRRWSPRWIAGRGAVPLEVLQRLPVGPRQAVLLLRVGERVLVVASGEAGPRLLAELDGDTARRALTAEPSAGAPPRRTLLARLRWLPAALLLLAPLRSLPAQITAPHAPAVAAPHRPAAPAAPLPTAPQFHLSVGDGTDRLELAGPVGIVVLIGVLTLLPMLFLLMTSFTRILVVLNFLRMAIGTQTAPPTQFLIALSILLSGVVMSPVLDQANREALQPYREGKLTQAQAYQAALVPFRHFMMANTREQSLAALTQLTGADSVRSADDLPTITLMSAFATSELTTAFQIGFVLFLPFVVIDLIVASVLVSMGMFMLPPVMVSLPFKLLLFVLADGWTLIVQNLVLGFHH